MNNELNYNNKAKNKIQSINFGKHMIMIQYLVNSTANRNRKIINNN